MNGDVIKEIINVFGTIVVAIITGMFSYKAAENKIKKIPELKKHLFFIRIESLKGEVTRSFTLENKGKEVVFKEIIIAQLSIFDEILGEFVNDVENKSINDEAELYSRCLRDFENINRKLHCFYNTDYRYNEEEKNVIRIVMSKYENWNEDIVNHCKDSFYMVCNSPFYLDVPTKAAIILDSYMSISIDTINYAEKTLNSINGDLRGLSFKGTTI